MRAIAHLHEARFNFVGDHLPQLNWQPSDGEPLWVASVVPEQTTLFQQQMPLHLVTLDHIPLKGLYPSLGIDRAIALWGAVNLYGAPALVIDAGTALTFTAVNGDHTFMGGAIAPGLGLMLRSLSSNTAALPAVDLGATVPPRWAFNTAEAICSGALYTAAATIKDFIQDWQTQSPSGGIVLTGGDGALLIAHLMQRWPAIAQHIAHDPNLIFHGIGALMAHQVG